MSFFRRAEFMAIYVLVALINLVPTPWERWPLARHTVNRREKGEREHICPLTRISRHSAFTTHARVSFLTRSGCITRADYSVVQL